MDSKKVNSQIRQVIRPMLETAGFDKFNSRNAWRVRTESIAVVNFQSFSADKAASLECTSYSFAVNLGLYYRCFGPPAPPVMVAGTGMPHEYSCQARIHLEKTIHQAELPRSDIWYVSENDEELDPVIEDARRVIETTGLPWLERFGDPNRALDAMLIPRCDSNPEYVFPRGTLGAAQCGEVLGRHLGRISDAILLWDAVLKQPFYARNADVIDKARRCKTELEQQKLR